MLEINNISLAYKAEEDVLKDISLYANEGECILLTGKSGSGKSSIINSINGLSTRYDGGHLKGDIKISGKAIKNLELYEISMLVASVFQNPKTYFFNVNSTLELLFYLENIGLTREEMDKRLSEMLEVFEIQALMNRDIFKLSGGEKQILCVAASYISGANIIVLDEPSSNLDDVKIRVLSEMLAKLKDRGITLIVGEHRIFYLMDIVDRIFLIQDGRIKSEYKRDEFFKLETEELNKLGIRDKLRTELTVHHVEETGNLEIKSLCFNFERMNRTLCIKDIGFNMGKIYGIIGENGVGKSTFVRCMIGVERKSKDEVYLEGKKLSKRERLKMSSLVMQDVNHQLFTDSVASELELGIKNLEEDKVRDVLEKLDLTQLKNRHPMSLSGGQKQRVAIASVICKDSKFIFFDEPTSGMDYANMIRISNLIKTCKRDDNIIFIVSHDAEFLNKTADYVVDIKRFNIELR